ncbi:unnamed protein product [Enterobius vermicularis]|uniref:RING-type domain-containing protein n=1 Tax=Enterobius vermicularis TaxID=51028 RepID=A0A3P6IG19_ENTVE|nr:unnamed protein product [Enterobius vermicularis]
MKIFIPAFAFLIFSPPSSLCSCVICYENLNIEDISAIPCGHTFHYKCLLSWIRASFLCKLTTLLSTFNVFFRLFFSLEGKDDSEGSAGGSLNNENKTREVSIHNFLLAVSQDIC